MSKYNDPFVYWGSLYSPSFKNLRTTLAIANYPWPSNNLLTSLNACFKPVTENQISNSCNDKHKCMYMYLS